MHCGKVRCFSTVNSQGPCQENNVLNTFVKTSNRVFQKTVIGRLMDCDTCFEGTTGYADRLLDIVRQDGETSCMSDK
jgi:hypothetical protein